MAGWTKRLARIVRHQRWDPRDTRRLLPADALARLEQRIAAAEAGHSGEIRICVEAALPMGYLSRDLRPRDRALTLFGKLRVWDTEHRNGVLIYLLLAEHAIEVVADRGLDRVVPPETWPALVRQLGERFRAGRFEDGLAQAVDAVQGLLAAHFTLVPGQANPDELSNRIDLR